jgi:hypothetical protein
MHDVTDRDMWIAEGVELERTRIKQMIMNVIDNPSIAIDSVPPRMALQVLAASLEPDEE